MASIRVHFMQSWISLRSRIFRGAKCFSMVLELWRGSSPERHFSGGKVRLLKRSSQYEEDCSG
jgi:hypothetical protein